LEFSSVYTLTDASGPSTPDGTFTGSATSSNGTIRYAIDNPGFDYATGQTTPVFTGLYSGPHTVYAKDAIGCQDSISFEILVTVLYNVKYRLEFTDTFSESRKDNRMDILERAYSGPVIEICSGATPIVIRYEGDRDDPNVVIVPSNAVIELLVETEGQFNELFQCDDRKYLVNHYVDSSLYWKGYIVPEFQSEPYLFEPYVLSITASDGLGELKNAAFKDMDKNSYKGDLSCMFIISEILKKTGLPINIRCAVNVFDSGMATTATKRAGTLPDSTSKSASRMTSSGSIKLRRCRLRR
jgi:hypothetical protein